MNTKNQKPVLEGFKNRIDQLGEDKASQARQAALQAMTGPDLMAHIAKLAAALTPANFTPTANPNN